jgi:hypothetical protein
VSLFRKLNHRHFSGYFHPKRSDRTQSTRAPEEEKRGYGESSKHLLGERSKKPASFSALVLCVLLMAVSRLTVRAVEFIYHERA